MIGNPPWGANVSDILRDYIKKSYNSYEYQLNSFAFFLEKGITLLKQTRTISFILPAVFLNQYYFQNIRKIVLINHFLSKVLLLRYKVFLEANTGDTCIIVIQKGKSKHLGQVQYAILPSEKKFPDIEYQSYKNQSAPNNSRHEIQLLSDSQKILENIQVKSISLGEIAICIMGIKPYQKGKGKPKQNEKIVNDRVFDSDKKLSKDYKHYLIGKDINRYLIKPLKKRYIKYGEFLAEPRFTAPFEKEKIILRQTSDIIRCVIDSEKYYNLNNIYNITLRESYYDIRYICGLLNSKIMVAIYQSIVPEAGRLFAEVKKINLDKLPIPKLDLSNPAQKAQHDRMAQLVDQMLDTQKRLHTSKTESDRKHYQQRADILDKQIDTLVYELYDLTPKEIRVVEGEG